MAQFIFDHYAQEYGLNEYAVESKAVSREEIGNDIYPSAKLTLDKHSIPYTHHYSSQVSVDDYQTYDYLICMDQSNISRLQRIVGDDKEHKIYLLLDFIGRHESIADPWYSDNFELAYQQIKDGCIGLIHHLISK